MCVYANRSILRYGVSKYSNASRSLAHYDRELDRKFEYTRCRMHLFFSMFPPVTPIYVTQGDFFQFPATASTGGRFSRALVQFEIKTSLKDQGGVGSDNFNLRTPYEEYFLYSININDVCGSTRNAENYIISAGKHMDRNMVLIIRNLHNPHLICNIITVYITYNVTI